MKKFMHFTMLTVIPVSLAILFCVGCQKAGKKESTKQKSITIMVDGTWLGPDDGEEIPEKGFEAITGIDLIINHPPHNEYKQKLDLAFTTGDIPDVFVVYPLQYIRYATAGALYEMTEFYENSKMKNNMSNQEIIDACRINGKLYGIPHHRGNGTLTYVRGDWLEKLGLDPPKDYAEFIEMLRAFKHKNPDGLKPNDVIPITGPGLANDGYPMDIYLREFYQHATPDYVEKNGKWVDGMLEPNMKDALRRMRDAYAEGLIDPEIITNKTSTCRNKFYSGIVGAFNYWAGYWNDRLYVNTKPNVPHVKVVGIPAIKESFYVERPPGILCMSSKVKDPKAIFDNFFELINDMGEGQNNFTFGVEGESYIEKDGVKEFLPRKLNPDRAYDKVFIDPSLVVTKWAPKFKKDPLTAPSLEMFRKYNVQYGLPNPSEELGKLQKEIIAIKMSYISKIVYGDLTIEGGLKKYTNEIKKYNETVLPDMNK
jgi:putative aldouronate transport system substrate-binding protein